jgi:hypothetical protein
MYINQIYAAPVAFAHALAAASRAQSQAKELRQPVSSVGTPPTRHFSVLGRLAHWWRRLDEHGVRATDPVQLLMWSEPWGRPYNAALGVVLLINHLRKDRIKSAS